MAMLILGTALALAQAAAAAPPVRPPEKPHGESFAGQCVAVAVSSAEAPRSRVSFSATRILDLQFGALLRSRINGEHVLNLQVYTPQGHLYQQIDVPFRGGTVSPTGGATATTASETAPRMRKVEGYPQPLPEQELAAARTPSGQRGYRVSARLPVAGTSIMTSSLYGKWKVIPHIDGSLRACGAPTVFSIKQ
jgi:hypothetical protein